MVMMMMRSVVVVVTLIFAVAFSSASDNSDGKVTPVISDSEIQQVLATANRQVRDELQKSFDRAIYANATRLNKRSLAPEVVTLEERHVTFDRAAETISDKYNIDFNTARALIVERAAPHSNFNPNLPCQRQFFNCDFNSPYRTADGTCNNPGDPTLGRSIVEFDRLLAPDYSDGDGAFRLSVAGGQLPPARVVSSNIHIDRNRPHQFITHMVVGFGQFLDHDMTSTPECQTPQCCQKNDRECMPIRFPANDPVYGQFGISCIDVCRSIRACNTRPREQINQNTAFIDASQIYGNSLDERRQLRAFRNGLLRSGVNSRMLPQDRQSANCGIPQNGIFCFQAGDDRVNENPLLTSMHTLFFREHNRIASILQSMNPMWNDETTFQETKRIITAEIQNVVYNEFLPTILGSTQMNNWNLNLPVNSYTSYDVNTRPNIFNSFSTASYRFGHTLIQNFFNLFRNGNFPLATSFQNPDVIYRQADNVERIIIGLTEQPSQGYENFMATAVTSHLFQKPGAQIGTDLASLNIQRGRDHGLPSYVHWRQFCGLSRPANFNQLLGIMFSQDTVDSYFNTYAHIDDIDFWSAGISENPVNGGVMGPTFACIVGRQFRRLKDGDRYFFTHGAQSGTFPSNQLSNLRQRTLAGIICDNVALASNTQFQQNVFQQPSQNNPIMSCNSQPKLNLNLWRV